MQQFEMEIQKRIPAPPETVYAVLSDYRVGHQAILPKPYFTDMIVEEGGQGAGTKLTVHMTVMGDKRTFRQIVEEPEPGRILIERDIDSGQGTQFTLDAANNGQQTDLTLNITFMLRPGVQGWIEGLISRLVLRRIFNKELQNLTQYVTTDVAAYQAG